MQYGGLPPIYVDTDIVTNGYFHHRDPQPIAPMEVGAQGTGRTASLPGPSIRLAANLDVDDMARRSPKPGIAVGHGDDALMFVTSP
jgi:hypothetical protein